MASDLHRRIESSIRTAKQWESDKSLLAEIRASIPIRELVPELVCETEAQWRLYLNKTADGEAKEEAAGDSVNYRTSCFEKDDAYWEGDDLFLKRLTRYFKQEVMKWCNQPPCSNPNCKGNEDGKQMESKGVRGPETEAEKVGQAGRVEVYNCKLCGTETTFPRFNSPRALFQSRRGRCGEFANLFGTYCRALGFDTRYILDFTDHVWVEVWSARQQRWLHADACEGLIDRPNMYEQGWGKKLNYALGATHDSVADVTKRYTRKFYSDEFQARRREYAPDENASDRIFRQMNDALRQMNNTGKGRLEEIEKRGKAEAKFFGMVQSSGVWDVDYREGRISGSLAWKASRRELGDSKTKVEGVEGKESEEEETQTFFVESLFPSSRHNDLKMIVQPPMPSNVPSPSPKAHPECIVVSGVPSAVTLTNGISAVIVDEASGCILQSAAFSNLSAAGSFLDTVPDGRIVAICRVRDDKPDGSRTDTSLDDSTTKILGRLGGFCVEAATTSSNSCFLFVGQVNFHPKWATSLETSDSKQSIKVSIQLNISSPLKARLRSEINTVPVVVSTRLPETIMPLQTQLAASHFQKRAAFNAYMKNGDSQNSTVIGYTTRPDAPVYLIDNQSFPFRKSEGQTHNPIAGETSWMTFHYLPDPLVPDDDEITEEKISSSNNTNVPKFDIPIADDYFAGLLGNQLLVKNAASTPTLMDTANALANTRLVALYFSAQWCGPCRGFTPLLIEFYNVLKKVAPSHGLELVFVSSDQDEGQFQQYYGKMPFAALPFSNRSLAQQAKSIFGVRGIPSLVVVDALSGRIVASPDESRREVHQACQRGEEAIETLFRGWLEKVPPESTSMLDILALSCQEVEAGTGEAKETVTANTKSEQYLKMKERDKKKNTVDPSARVKELFSQLVAKGMEPNAAAVEAIKQATVEQKKPLVSTELEEGTIQGTCENCAVEIENNTIDMMVEKICQLNAGDKSKIVMILSTAKKYVANVRKDPSNPRFRNFRLSNKVFDRITSNPGSIELLMKLGFVVFHSDLDFVASIPLSVDLTLMGDVFDNLLTKYSS
eukprot:CAMPEP_0201663636 /NCGR_PEP_ID=MMETSP0494-20130426/5360_1 /ASSEMBLY_ACC=CAM_ASM_000839 /TAXON_ID=420259 /ORGANISM="Thalassiosira gravida, Strain GMp14c1" /LENGTH=1060 /DNA_ID=CAMNT_0048142267 /DNA_START=184 /DNA_END=3366 /DNA_ORIENTATION=+